jgi:hypothetical protein
VPAFRYDRTLHHTRIVFNLPPASKKYVCAAQQIQREMHDEFGGRNNLALLTSRVDRGGLGDTGAFPLTAAVPRVDRNSGTFTGNIDCEHAGSRDTAKRQFNKDFSVPATCPRGVQARH